MTGNDSRPRRTDERGQAFTLEGFIASVVVLSAVLFALQAVVLTSTSGGQVDQEVRQQLKIQARDIMTASAHNGSQDLSYLVRLFGNETDRNTWERATGSTRTGYGSKEPYFHRNTVFGNALNATYKQRGFSYNVVIEYLSATEPNATEESRIVYRGVPTEEAVSVTYTMVLYDNQTITGAPASGMNDCTEQDIEGIYRNGPDWNDTNGNCYFPVPESSLFDDDSNTGTPGPCSTGSDSECENREESDSPIYNIVEVRVVIW